MSDVVVTCPKALWREWLDEGDLAHDEGPDPAAWTVYYEYGFHMGGTAPEILPGERVYIVAHGRLRGWAPLVYVEHWPKSARFGARPGAFALVRHGGAVACTLDEPVRGFQGWRRRWWDYTDERPFPNWRTEGIS